MTEYLCIMLACSALFFAVGSALYRGRTDLIHDYHTENVSEEDKAAYTKAFSKGMFTLSASMAASGICALFSLPLYIFVSVLFAGIIISLVIFIAVQKKYNKR